jgi:3'-phosphoadenosine 5'-phosphosulfate sulfotransferase (PAPS reductase)/FAD synthetase
MNNIISVSGGNDSIAMLIVIDRIRKQDSEFFKNDTWQVCYFNTGWARDGWDIRVKLIKDMCDKYELKFNELKASVMNEHRTTENDELFAQVPDEDKYGMIAFIKKKKFFPNVKMKYCTQSLKITPMHRWLKANKLNRKNSRQWVGIRREEGGRLGGTAGGNLKDRAFTTSLGERHGFDAVFPIAYMSEIQRDKLLKENNIDIYPSRSEECYPCIYQMSVRELADIDASRIELINEFEVKVTEYRNATSDLMGIKYAKGAFFGMFNKNKCGNNAGIVAQQKWAEKRVEYLNSLPKQQGLFQDEVIIHDKCSSGYCGT